MTHKETEKVLERILGTAERLPAEDPGFYTRLGANFADIYGHLHHLYGGNPEFDTLVGRLVELLARKRSDRAPGLKELDSQRTANPRWFLSNELVSTMLYVDRYAGTFSGLAERVPYLNEVGVNLIHLMPVLEMPEGENDGGYAVSNYRRVDPRLGTLNELVGLCKTLHDEGMLLQLDVVVNHTASSHEWAQRARRGEERYRNYYHTFAQRDVPDRFEQSMPEVFPESAPGNFTYDPTLARWVMTVFNEYQWDLNYGNPEVLLEMIDVLLFYANLGVDVLRLDAVPFMWKRVGTTCQNQPEAHMLLQLFHACVRIVAPAVALMGEAVVPPKELVRYFGEGRFRGRECEMAYHVLLMVVLWDMIATRNTRLFRTSLERVPQLPPDTTWIVYARCHDDIGLGYADEDIRDAGYDPALHRRFMVEYFTGEHPYSNARGATFMYDPKTQDARISGTTASLLGLEAAVERGDDEEISMAIDRIALLYGVVFSFGGIPILYYGDEVGYTNDYSYVNERNLKDDNRWMHRPCIDWERMERRNREGTVEARLFERITTMVRARKQLREFASDAARAILDTDTEHVLAYLRFSRAGRTVVLANVTDLPQYSSTALLSRAGLTSRAVDCISGESLTLRSGNIVLAPYEMRWLRERLPGGEA